MEELAGHLRETGRTAWGKRASMKFTLPAALGALALLCPPAWADFKPIDCGSTSFEMAEPGYNIDCERSTGTLRAGSSTGGATTDVMSVTSDDRTIFVTMVDHVITAQRIYLEHRGLRESFNDTFGDEDVRGWKNAASLNGYDVAEFSEK